MLVHLLVVLAVLALLAPAAGAQSEEPEATTALTVVEPNGSGDVLAELDEYATQVLGDPWDMNESTDLDFFYPFESSLSDSAFSNGVYAADDVRRRR